MMKGKTSATLKTALVIVTATNVGGKVSSILKTPPLLTGVTTRGVNIEIRASQPFNPNSHLWWGMSFVVMALVPRVFSSSFGVVPGVIFSSVFGLLAFANLFTGLFAKWVNFKISQVVFSEKIKMDPILTSTFIHWGNSRKIELLVKSHLVDGSFARLGNGRLRMLDRLFLLTPHHDVQHFLLKNILLNEDVRLFFQRYFPSFLVPAFWFVPYILKPFLLVISVYKYIFSSDQHRNSKKHQKKILKFLIPEIASLSQWVDRVKNKLPKNLNFESSPFDKESLRLLPSHSVADLALYILQDIDQIREIVTRGRVNKKLIGGVERRYEKTFNILSRSPHYGSARRIDLYRSIISRKPHPIWAGRVPLTIEDISNASKNERWFSLPPIATALVSNSLLVTSLTLLTTMLVILLIHFYRRTHNPQGLLQITPPLFFYGVSSTAVSSALFINFQRWTWNIFPSGISTLLCALLAGYLGYWLYQLLHTIRNRRAVVDLSVAPLTGAGFISQNTPPLTDFTISSNGLDEFTDTAHARFHDEGKFKEVISAIGKECGLTPNKGGHFDFRKFLKGRKDHVWVTKNTFMEVDENNILVILDRRFNADHAGRDSWCVYARNHFKAVHEKNELLSWRKFAVDNSLISETTLKPLGETLKNWANGKDEGLNNEMKPADRQAKIKYYAKEFHTQAKEAEKAEMELLRKKYEAIIVAGWTALNKHDGVQYDYRIDRVSVDEIIHLLSMDGDENKIDFSSLLLLQKEELEGTDAKRSNPDPTVSRMVESFFDKHGGFQVSFPTFYKSKTMSSSYFNRLLNVIVFPKSSPQSILSVFIEAQGGFVDKAFHDAVVAYLSTRIQMENAGMNDFSPDEVLKAFSSFGVNHPLPKNVHSVAALVNQVGLDALLKAFVNGDHDDMEEALGARWENFLLALASEQYPTDQLIQSYLLNPSALQSEPKNVSGFDFVIASQETGDDDSGTNSLKDTSKDVDKRIKYDEKYQRHIDTVVENLGPLQRDLMSGFDSENVWRLTLARRFAAQLEGISADHDDSVIESTRMVMAVNAAYLAGRFGLGFFQTKKSIDEKFGYRKNSFTFSLIRAYVSGRLGQILRRFLVVFSDSKEKSASILLQGAQVLTPKKFIPQRFGISWKNFETTIKNLFEPFTFEFKQKITNKNYLKKLRKNSIKTLKYLRDRSQPSENTQYLLEFLSSPDVVVVFLDDAISEEKKNNSHVKHPDIFLVRINDNAAENKIEVMPVDISIGKKGTLEKKMGQVTDGASQYGRLTYASMLDIARDNQKHKRRESIRHYLDVVFGQLNKSHKINYLASAVKIKFIEGRHIAMKLDGEELLPNGFYLNPQALKKMEFSLVGKEIKNALKEQKFYALITLPLLLAVLPLGHPLHMGYFFVSIFVSIFLSYFIFSSFRKTHIPLLTNPAYQHLFLEEGAQSDYLDRYLGERHGAFTFFTVLGFVSTYFVGLIGYQLWVSTSPSVLFLVGLSVFSYIGGQLSGITAHFINNYFKFFRWGPNGELGANPLTRSPGFSRRFKTLLLAVIAILGISSLGFTQVPKTPLGQPKAAAKMPSETDKKVTAVAEELSKATFDGARKPVLEKMEKLLTEINKNKSVVNQAAAEKLIKELQNAWKNWPFDTLRLRALDTTKLAFDSGVNKNISKEFIETLKKDLQELSEKKKGTELGRKAAEVLTVVKETKEKGSEPAVNPGDGFKDSLKPFEITDDWKKSLSVDPKRAFDGKENVKVIADPRDPNSKVLEIKYPKGSVDPSFAEKKKGPMGGTVFYMQVPEADQMYLTYEVEFQEGFDFVKGGKLPGLFGGKTASGGQRAPNSFSTRLHWRANGEGELYLYVFDPDSKEKSYGKSIGRGSWTFKPGQKYKIEQIVTLNTVGKKDGKVEVFVDGKKVVVEEGIEFRTDKEAKISHILFSTFFGGDDETWASKKDLWARFGKLGVSSKPRSHSGSSQRSHLFKPLKTFLGNGNLAIGDLFVSEEAHVKPAIDIMVETLSHMSGESEDSLLAIPNPASEDLKQILLQELRQKSGDKVINRIKFISPVNGQAFFKEEGKERVFIVDSFAAALKAQQFMRFSIAAQGAFEISDRFYEEYGDTVVQVLLLAQLMKGLVAIKVDQGMTFDQIRIALLTATHA
ncbi:MAG: polysaccharide lyase [Elusimicrobiota bacterium]